MDVTIDEQVNGNEEKQIIMATPLRYAGFWTRFWAYLLDLIIVGSLNRILVYPVLRGLDIQAVQEGMFTVSAVSTTIVMYAYFAIMTKFLQQTLGKMVFGLKVFSLRHDHLTWGDVLFREVIGKFISKTVLFLGFIAIAFTKKKQGFHDYFADTSVVHE